MLCQTGQVWLGWSCSSPVLGSVTISWAFSRRTQSPAHGSDRKASPEASGKCRKLPPSFSPHCLLQPPPSPVPGLVSRVWSPVALEEGALTFLLQNVLSGLDECQDVGIRLAVSGEWDGRHWLLRDSGDSHMSHFTTPCVWAQCLPFQSAFSFPVTQCHPGHYENEFASFSLPPLICAVATAKIYMQIFHVLATSPSPHYYAPPLALQLTQSKPICPGTCLLQHPI